MNVKYKCCIFSCSEEKTLDGIYGTAWPTWTLSDRQTDWWTNFLQKHQRQYWSHHQQSVWPLMRPWSWIRPWPSLDVVFHHYSHSLCIHSWVIYDMKVYWFLIRRMLDTLISLYVAMFNRWQKKTILFSYMYHLHLIKFQIGKLSNMCINSK